VSAAPRGINEGETATYTVTASSVNPNAATIVNYSMKGKAVLGTHYTLSGVKGQIRIPTGQSSASVSLTALKTNLAQGRKTARMLIIAGTDYKVSSRGRRANVIIANVP
jgi:hypothetical protein